MHVSQSLKMFLPYMNLVTDGEWYFISCSGLKLHLIKILFLLMTELAELIIYDQYIRKCKFDTSHFT